MPEEAHESRVKDAKIIDRARLPIDRAIKWARHYVFPALLVLGLIFAVASGVEFELPERAKLVISEPPWFWIVSVLIGILLINWIRGGDYKKALGVAALIVLPLIALPIYFHCDEACEAGKAAEAQRQSERRVAAAAEAAAIADARAYPKCLRKRIPVTFGETPIRIDPDCAPDFFWEGKHCLYLKTLGNDTVHGPYGDCDESKGTPRLKDIVEVWSAEEPFNGSYRLVPPRYVSWFQ